MVSRNHVDPGHVNSFNDVGGLECRIGTGRQNPDPDFAPEKARHGLALQAAGAEFRRISPGDE
jgi:hypothetical protein